MSPGRESWLVGLKEWVSRWVFGFLGLGVLLFVLIGLAIPVRGGPGEIFARAKMAETNHTLSSLQTALKGYEMEYGHLPPLTTDPLPTKDSDWIPLIYSSPQGKALLECLLGIGAPDSPVAPNPREIPFYEPRYSGTPKKSGFYDGTPKEGFRAYKGSAPAGLYDPWGQPYYVKIDRDGDGHLAHGFDLGKKAESLVRKTLLVCSLGEGGIVSKEDRPLLGSRPYLSWTY